MTKLIALAALLLLLPSAAYAQKVCDQTRTAQTNGPTVRTERVAALAGKRVYICGYMIMRGLGGQDLEFELTSGTGRDCQTNTQIVIPRMLIPPQGIVNRIPYAGEKTGPAEAMCLQTWGTGPVTSVFYWAQY